MKTSYAHLDQYSLNLYLWKEGRLNTSTHSDIDCEMMMALAVEEDRHEAMMNRLYEMMKKTQEGQSKKNAMFG